VVEAVGIVVLGLVVALLVVALVVVVLVVVAATSGVAPALGAGVVVVMPGPGVGEVATWAETVTTPRPRSEYRYGPPTTSVERNIARAVVAETRGVVVPAGSTTRPPLSSSTWETKRPCETDENDGSPDPVPPLADCVQAQRVPTATNDAAARSKVGRGCTGHSLPAPWR
jgi:hypothetical protein